MTAVHKPRASPAWRAAGWIVASAAALLAVSRWLSATSVGYLVLATTATAAGAGFVVLLPRPQRRWAAGCVAILALCVALAANTQHQFALLQNDWPRERARITSAALSALGDEVGRAVQDVRH